MATIYPPEIKLAPPLEALQKRIDSAKSLNSKSVEVAAITDLFKPFFGTDDLVLTNMNFGSTDENVLQVDANTSFYGKAVRIAAVFTLSGEDISLTLNNIGELEITLQDMVKDGLIPPSSSYPVDKWPTVAITGIGYVMDSAGKTLTISTGSGAQWDFLGYTNLIIDKPGIFITMSMTAGNTISVGGTLKSKDGKVNIPVAIQLPIGLNSWMISLTEPVELKSALSIIDALADTDVTSLIPEEFSNKLDTVNIESFSADFDSVSKKIFNIGLQVVTTDRWEIVQDKLELQKGITFNLMGQRNSIDGPLTYSGGIYGTAAVNYSDPEKIVLAKASIPIPFTGTDWQIRLANNNEDIGLGRLIAIVPGAEAILPKGLLAQLNKIEMEFLQVNFSFNGKFSFTKVAFFIHSEEAWQLPMLQSAVYLDGLKFGLDIDLPYNSATASGQLAGNIQIADGTITIPVSIDKSKDDEEWFLSVTSDEIPLPSISDLADFMGGNVLVAAMPSGLMDIGDFAIYDLNLKWQLTGGSKLQLFAFTISSTPDTVAWDMVPGYFSLTDLYIQLKIENKSVSDKDISGAIGTSVKLVLNKEEDKNLVMSMVAAKPSTEKPWNFSGSLEEDLELKALLLGLKLPQSVVGILPDLTVTQFDLSIEPTSKSFSCSMTISPTDSWTIVSIGTVGIDLGQIFFKIEHYADNTNLEARGNFNIGTETVKCPVEVAATYNQQIWNFTGTFDNTGEQKLTINDVLKKYIPGIDAATIPQVAITKIDVDFEKGPLTTLPEIVNYSIGEGQSYTTLDFSIQGQLTLEVLPSFSVSAAVQVLYDSRKTPVTQYDGTNLQGKLIFGGLSFEVISKYADGKFSKHIFRLVYKGITAECEADISDPDIVKFSFTLKATDPNKGLSLGDIISTLIEAATGEAANIPSPWDFINKIPLDGFGFVFTYNKTTKAKTIGLTYKPNINLGFITIDELSLIYSPDADKDTGPVDFRVTKGTFLGVPIDSLANEEKPAWDLRKPENAPAVPGMGDAAFKLEHLSLGNQVAIKDSTPPVSVVQAITDLEKAFDEPGDLPASLYFDKNYDWLIGAQFKVIKYISVAVVFYDPVIYGLSIGVADGKFKGLDFQVLYKKVSDNVGMYQIDLTLPDFVRKQQLGAVAITLPSLSLSIYTNGDFLIDMGFPHNADFGRSFGLEFSIFTGAGGFYFGKLSNDTAANFHLPATKGQFNPVIVFGIGIKAGVGRSIDKGILKAELSLTLQVILEGIFAWFNANKPATGLITQDKEELYYRVQAQAALVGRVYGEIDFVIISASVDIIARIFAQLIVEAYRATQITFGAEVSASVKVRINLGLFKITISCSFSASISDTFTIGTDDDPAPWDLLVLPDRKAYFTALDADPVPAPEMEWTAKMDYPKESFKVLFLPQVSVKYDDASSTKKQGVGVSMLYVNNQPNSGEKTDFTIVSRAALAWTFNSYFSKKGKTKEQILDEPVTIDDLNAIMAYFNQPKFSDGLNEPFSSSDIYEYLFSQSFTDVTISTKTDTSLDLQNEAEQEVAFFPIFPLLGMSVTGMPDVDFMKDGKCDADYLKVIKDYFKEMKISFDNEPNPSLFRNREENQPETLAEYLFVDYFVMMAKSGIQDAVNDFKQMELTVSEGESLIDIALKNERYGVTAKELAFANRHKILNNNAVLRIPSLRYKLKNNENANIIEEKFPGLKTYILSDNIIEAGPFDFTVASSGTPHTLRTVSEMFGLDFNTFIESNIDNKKLFAEGTRLRHAFVAQKTVREILDYLQASEKFALANLGGTVSRFFLHGLRVPTDRTGKTRKGLYEATCQQFNLQGNIEELVVDLHMGESITQPGWLKFEGESKTEFKFDKNLADGINELISSTYQPSVTLDAQKDVKRYTLEAKTFTLPSGISWENPNPAKELDLTTSYIWKFPLQLQQYIIDNPNVPLNLMVQAKNTAFSLEQSEPVTPLFWGTSVEISIRQLPSASAPGEPMEMVYEVLGCGEADGMLLQDILMLKPTITDVDILFAPNESKKNDGEVVSGLVSDGLNKFKTFLLQTNYSTASNPQATDGMLANALTNLTGMDAITFLTYLWECSIVRSGGYYLSYNNGTGGGLPSYLFGEDGTATITLLVSYPIEPVNDSDAYLLPQYINCAVINKEIQPKEDNLFLEVYLTKEQKEIYDPKLQNIHATLLPGTALFRGTRINPELLESANLSQSAENQLSELFNLMEYHIEGKEGIFRSSNYALPAGPLVVNESVKNCLSNVPLRATAEDGWIYSAVAPVYPFVEPSTTEDPEKDPYSANGKAASISFNFLDIFGNTLQPDNDADTSLLQEVTPGYLDPVISLDQWPNVSKYYTVAADEAFGKPAINILLSFDTSRYESAGEDAAVRDKKFYQNITYQLAQPDVKVTLVSNIGSLETPVESPIELLRKFVKQILEFLDTVPMVITHTPLPIEMLIQQFIDKTQLNMQYLFSLEVSIEIERTGNIDPQFIDEPSIRFASSAIPPDFYLEDQGSTSGLEVFADMLEKALPVMKVAVGQTKPEKGPEQTFAERSAANTPSKQNNKEVWLMRFAGTTGEAGIEFSVSPAPIYYAPKPLSTKLISRPSIECNRPVPIRAYTAGNYIANAPGEYKDYSGVDIEVMARIFITAMDDFMSAEKSTKAWKVQNASANPGKTIPSPETTPFQVVEKAKKDIANAISRLQLTTILQEQSPEGLSQAQEAFKQQLLASLGTVYSINTVLYNSIIVQQGYDTLTANFYGKMEKAAEVTNTANYFSPVKLPLTKNNGGFSTLFSVRAETGTSDDITLIDEFKAGLNYHITNIEHDFGTPINNYVPSSWLSLVRPIICKGQDDKPLIDADIPIPLNAYPTAPSMVRQNGTASYPQDESKDPKILLEDALCWDYTFAFDYISAKQDLIYLNVVFNVQQPVNLKDFNDAEPDLFESLMQFNSCYREIMADIEKDDNNSLAALQSFAWMVQKTGNSWEEWLTKTANDLKLSKSELNFTIREWEDDNTGRLLVTITSSKSNPVATQLPIVEIEGFKTNTLLTKIEDTEEDNITYYFTPVSDDDEILLYADRKSFSQRTLRIKDNVILNDENAWAGISIHRNEILAGKPANKDFLYITPYIRFVDACRPSLYNTTVIDMAAFTPEANKDHKVKLQEFMENFFTALMGSNEQIVMQLKCGYSFDLQQRHAEGFVGLGPILPILLTVPTEVTKTGMKGLLDNIATAVNTWVKTNRPEDENQTGQLRFQLSLYSALSQDSHNPILTLDNLQLNTDIIDFNS